MKKLNLPGVKEMDLYDACTREMTDSAKQKFIRSRPEIETASKEFAARSATQTWFQLPRVGLGRRNQIVAGELSKGDLMDLYAEGVVNSTSSPRAVYDQILVAAQGRCPYCADIGTARTLDHYLPKSRFPQFSVHPHNLVPACRDCNTDAGAGFPEMEDLQPIHPYLDRECFFSERWIRAEVIRCDPIGVMFFAKPPAHWSDNDRRRAEQHFSDYKLRDRFSSQVSGEISPLIMQRKSSLVVFSAVQFKAHLSIVADDANLLLNGWKRTLYHALCESDWFTSADFNGDWLGG